MNTAWPAVTETVPNEVAPSLNVTVPACTVSNGAVTVAVKATFCPNEVAMPGPTSEMDVPA